MTLPDGRVLEQRQPHIREGVHEPLTRDDIARKFIGNAVHGGWDVWWTEAFVERIGDFFMQPVNLAAWRE